MTQQWWSLSRGDLDTTIAQLGFNLAQMVIPVFLLIPVGISAGFSVTHLLPGYALGFLTGSLGLVFLAERLARREARTNVTAHVYGNNVPAIIAYTLSIMLPVYLETHDANRAWEIGAAAVVWTGIIKLAAAPFAGVFRRFIPAPAAMTVFGAAMYSYLALVLLQRVFDQPLVGLIALGIIFTARPGQYPDHPLAHSSVPGSLDRPPFRGARHRICASQVVRTIVADALLRNAGTLARHDARAALSFRDRAHRDLSSTARHRVGGRSRGGGRRL